MNNQEALPSPTSFFCERQTVETTCVSLFIHEAEKLIATHGAKVDLIVNTKNDRIYGFVIDGAPRLSPKQEDDLASLFSKFFALKTRLTLSHREHTGFMHYRFTGI
ncbi:hypothetical protein [Herbaspirillum aquaticum]|uniref:hypothetical protein n=1 Tax=Herbaspirillum aquaticum TaxID=568783 RepID=UPI0024DE243B|nr:hypothetical protein [Herbaspirillum aquaticum]